MVACKLLRCTFVLFILPTIAYEFCLGRLNSGHFVNLMMLYIVRVHNSSQILRDKDAT